MINFSEHTRFLNLHPIDSSKCSQDLPALLIPGEKVISAFRTVRDQVIFTNKRVITIDIQGVGVKKDFASIPYSRVQYYSIQTEGFLEIVPNCELQLFFADGFAARFEFSGGCDIISIGRAISEYVL